MGARAVLNTMLEIERRSLGRPFTDWAIPEPTLFFVYKVFRHSYLLTCLNSGDQNVNLTPQIVRKVLLLTSLGSAKDTYFYTPCGGGQVLQGNSIPLPIYSPYTTGIVDYTYVQG
jgi:hypothetical protein